MWQVAKLGADSSAPNAQRALCVRHRSSHQRWNAHAQADPAQAAADAADEAVGGGPEGPAAAAAGRAAASGLTASRQGFAGVGGASGHMAALRELVTLPLQARLLHPCLLSGCLEPCLKLGWWQRLSWAPPAWRAPLSAWLALGSL